MIIILCLLFGFIIGGIVGGIIVYAVTKDENDKNIRNAYIGGYTIGNLEKILKKISDIQEEK